MIHWFFTKMLHPFVASIRLTLLKIVCLLVAIAYFTIAERKIRAAIQRRRGPNVVGIYGLLQPLADGLKLLAKERVIPSHSNGRIFVIAPMLVLTLGLRAWSVIPFGCHDHTEYSENYYIIRNIAWSAIEDSGNLDTQFPPKSKMQIALSQLELRKAQKLAAASTTIMLVAPRKNKKYRAQTSLPAFTFADFKYLTEANSVADVRYGLLLILALSSLTVYGLIISGWASNSKYAFLGALRSAAQRISYEVSISLVILPVRLLSGSLNFTEIVHSQRITVSNRRPLFPISGIYLVSRIAETNRTPFDLPEAEAELVAGYNVDYSSIIFARFFLAEYGNRIRRSVQKSRIFLGGAGVDLLQPIFNSFIEARLLSVKTLLFCFIFVLVRATFPRYRYDQLRDIGWKTFLPVATGFFLFVVGVLVCADTLPIVKELRAPGYDE